MASLTPPLADAGPGTFDREKRALRTLTDAEDLLREVVGVSQEVIYHTDVGGHWRLLSPSWTNLTGYTVEETLGQTTDAIVHPEDRATLRALMQPLYAKTCASVRGRLRIHTRDGVTRWVDLSCSVSRDATGRPTGSAGTLVDATVRHAFEAIATATEDMDLRLIGEKAHHPVLDRVCAGLVSAHLASCAFVAVRAQGGAWETAGGAGTALPALQQAMARRDGRLEELEPFASAMCLGEVRSTAVAAPQGEWAEAARAGGVENMIAVAAGVEAAVDLLVCIGTDGPPGVEPHLVGILGALARRVALGLAFRRHQASMALHTAAMEASATALLIVDHDGRIDWVNAAFERLSGFARSELVGKATGEVWGADHWPGEAMDPLMRALTEGNHARHEVPSRRKDGTAYVASVTVSPVLVDGSMTHVIAALEDITARKEAEALIEHMARHDTVTQLPNRAYFSEHLARELARSQRTGASLAVLFVDLDRFKMVNDTLGHAAGDQLLRVVAERLTQSTRRCDFVARCGGDEFAIVAGGADGEGAAIVARRVVEALRRPVLLGEREVLVTASVGIAIGAPGGSDPGELLRQADAAMYRAKELGRNGLALFEAERDLIQSSSLTIHGALRRALATDELRLVYQPQIDMGSGELSGAEALLRWTSSELGVVSPADFVPIAEQTGLVVELDTWVLRHACRQARRWRDDGLVVPRVAVNISGVTVRHGELIATVQAALAESGLAPESLEIELTETAAMSDAQSITHTLDALADLGVRVALDDFGTGYSSLSYLKRFRIDTLKIDRSFITGLPDTADDAAIARLIVSMAHALRLDTVAEGVETLAQWTFLRALGCKSAQGFLMARGLDPAAFESIVRRRGWEEAIRLAPTPPRLVPRSA